MVANDLVADGQAQPRAFAHRLGGEEGVEDALHDLGRHPPATVLHRDEQAVGVGPALHPDAARAVHGLGGVGEEIQQHLIDLRGRTGDARQLAERLDHLGLVLDMVAGDQQGTADAVVEVHFLAHGAVQAGEILESGHQLGDLAQAVQGVVEQRAQVAGQQLGSGLRTHGRGAFQSIGQALLVAGRVVQASGQGRLALGQGEERRGQLVHQLDVVGHIAQRRVQLMGDARDHLAEGGHLFRLHQLGLGFLQVHQRLAQHPVALGNAQLHGLQQVEHRPQPQVASLLVHQDEIFGNGVLQLRGHPLGRQLQAGGQRNGERRRVHHVGHRAAAPEVAAETLHEDVLQRVAADQPQRQALLVHHRQRQESLVFRGQQAIGDITDTHVRGQRLHGLEQASQTAFGCHDRYSGD
ncbi:hypothetical protein FQZ97_790090 [compost metagenome]